jgi:hypothetical protein
MIQHLINAGFSAPPPDLKLFQQAFVSREGDDVFVSDRDQFRAGGLTD